MKKVLMAVVFWAVGLAFSCTAMAEEITIVGTGAGVAIVKAVGDVFHQINPEITITIPKSIGTGGGIKAVGRDEYMLGRVSRKIKNNEKYFGLTYRPFANMAIVFFTNKSVRIKNLSSQQICDIYSGKITNWKELGGKNARIKVVTREVDDSSMQTLLKLFPGFKNITVTSRSKTVFSDPEMLDIIEKKADTIGFGTYDNARNYKLDCLSINGKSSADDDYPYVNAIALIFKEKNNNGNIRKFIEFATSAAAHDAIRSAGGIPFR